MICFVGTLCCRWSPKHTTSYVRDCRCRLRHGRLSLQEKLCFLGTAGTHLPCFPYALKVAVAADALLWVGHCRNSHTVFPFLPHTHLFLLQVRTASCGATACVNSFGDEQLAVDLLADKLLFEALRFSGVCKYACSEEVPEPVDVGGEVSQTVCGMLGWRHSCQLCVLYEHATMWLWAW